MNYLNQQTQKDERHKLTIIENQENVLILTYLFDFLVEIIPSKDL